MMKISDTLEDLGLTWIRVDKLTRAAYHLFGLGTYFTAGERGACLTLNAVFQGSQAMGIIHLTFAKHLSVPT